MKPRTGSTMMKIPSERYFAISFAHAPPVPAREAPRVLGSESRRMDRPRVSRKRLSRGDRLRPERPSAARARSSTGKSGSPLAPVEREHVAHLGDLGERRHGRSAWAGRRGWAARARRSPTLVVYGLELPGERARVGAQREHRARVRVEALAVHGPVVGRGVAGRHVDEAERRVGGQDRPHVRGARPVLRRPRRLPAASAPGGTGSNAQTSLPLARRTRAPRRSARPCAGCRDERAHHQRDRPPPAAAKSCSTPRGRPRPSPRAARRGRRRRSRRRARRERASSAIAPSRSCR